jgi:hypothetical protein
VERNDESWPTSINAYHDTGDPDWDCAWCVAGPPPRGAGVRRADCQQSNRYTASQCRDSNHTSSNHVRHHDTCCNDHSNREANSGSDCHAGDDASSKRDRDSNSDASPNTHGDAHRDESANGVSNQDRERNGSAHDDSDRDTGSQANAYNDAHPNIHPTAERKREGDTGACASGLDEHHL